jgi:hypothetical protein
LLFKKAVESSDFLLLPELSAIVCSLGAALTVLTGRVVAPLNRTLVGVTAIAFEKELLPFPSAEPAN